MLRVKCLPDKKVLKAVGVGVFVSILVTFIALSLCTTLVTNEIDIANTTVSTIITYILSSFLGGTVAAKLNRENQYWCISLTAIIYFLLLFLLSVVLFQGLANGVGWCLISITAGSLGTLALNTRVKTRKKRRHSRR